MSKFACKADYFAYIAKQQAERTNPKPVVHFTPVKGENYKIGHSIAVLPVDHPAVYLNGRITFTTPVVKVNIDGSFETYNTVYVPTLDK
jgi:hypothetical protein